MVTVESSHNPHESRYEGRVDGELAGFAAYRLEGKQVVFTHAEVEDAYEGQGVGSAIARFALDDVRGRDGLRVVPRCPFIASWIDRHPDYQDLLRRS